jgi:hypothetical protein
VTFNNPVFKAFNDFDIDDMLPQADIWLFAVEGVEVVGASLPG